MAVPAITDITMRNAEVYFGNLATTNQYQVFIGDGWGKSNRKGAESFTQKFKNQEKIDFKSFGTKLGLLCTDASLPASTYATAEVKDNFLGVSQEFAHTRIYTDIDFTFYIDHDYEVLKFFEFWMNHVSGGSEIPQSDREAIKNGNYYRRFNYPKYYKNSEIYIKKFERDYLKGGQGSISYQFINAFPKSVTSIPVSYGPADLLKISVTLNYDRYLYGNEISPLDAPASSNPSNLSATTPQIPTQQESAEQRQVRLRKERTALIQSGQSPLSTGARISPRERSQNR